jgi:hypothetical protein
MATLPVSVPNTFQTQSGNIALSQLDNNFTTIYTTVNTIGNGTTALSNVNITGGNATLSIANIGNANLSNATIANVTVSNVTLNNGSLNNVVIGNTTPTNGTFTNLVATGGSLNNVVIGNVTQALGSFTYVSSSGNIAPTVNIGAISYGNLSYTDNNNMQVLTANVNSYAQLIVQNKNPGSAASSDIVLSNDTGNSTTLYINMGINSSNYAGVGPLNSANKGYLYTANTSITVATVWAGGSVSLAPNSYETIKTDASSNLSSSIYTYAGYYYINSPNDSSGSLYLQYYTGTGNSAALISSNPSSTAFGIYAANRLSLGGGYNYANSIPASVPEAIGINSYGNSVTIFAGLGTEGNVSFTVNGDTRFNGNINFSSGIASSNTYIGGTNFTGMSYFVNSLLYMYADSNGNVAIGRLGSVANSVFHWGSTTTNNVTQTIQNNTANASINLNLSNLTITSPGLTTINSTGNVLVSSAAATVNASGNVLVQGTNTTHSANGTFTVNSSGNVLVSSAANITISSASAFTINANANISIRANTGIGLGNIASPATLLHIGNTSLSNVAQTIQNNTANALIYLNLANLTITSPGNTTINSAGNISIIANTAIGLGNIASPATLLHIGNTSSQNVVVTIQDNTANGTIGLYNANLQIKTANTSGYIIFANSTANTVSLSNTAQLLVVGSGGSLGYGTGAGGNITQLTSKTTGVTLNTGAGSITMNNAALASNTSVTFLLTNSVIAATDSLIVNVQAGAATVGSYTTQVSTLAAGSANVTVRNITAGSLSEAVVLNFVVLKGATA